MSDNRMQEMAELLRSGARMLNEHCPVCGTPLFQLKTGEIYCSRCNKPVKILSADEDVDRVSAEAGLEGTLFKKLNLMQFLLEAEEEPMKVKELAETISVLLDVIEKLKS